MEIQEDFRDVLASFNAHKVDCLSVGAHAVAHHGAPRYSGDMDILVRPDRENARRISLSARGEPGKMRLGLTCEPCDYI